MSRRWRLASLGAGWWLVGVVLWMLLTSTVALNEVLTGLAAAGVAAVVVVAVHAHEHIAARARFRWIRFVFAVPVRVLVDTWLVTRLLVNRVRGHHVQGRYVEVHSPRSATAAERRGMEALTTLVASIAPNHYVVDFDEERRIVLVHQLVRRDHQTLEEVILES
jgi:multisubunit Na+/H+ antiporter MnhE subunit